MTTQANKYDRLNLSKEEQNAMERHAGLDRLREAAWSLNNDARQGSVLTKKIYKRVEPFLKELEGIIRSSFRSEDNNLWWSIQQKSKYMVRVKSETEQIYEQVCF